MGGGSNTPQGSRKMNWSVYVSRKRKRWAIGAECLSSFFAKIPEIYKPAQVWFVPVPLYFFQLPRQGKKCGRLRFSGLSLFTRGGNPFPEGGSEDVHRGGEGGSTALRSQGVFVRE